jgi:hypothetical protein
MADARKKKFKLLSDNEFWRLSADAKLHYLKLAVEVSGEKDGKQAGTPRKPVPPKKLR